MKKILMLGGAYSQIPAIRRAKELGYYVITCDYLPDNPGHIYADEYANISTVDKDAVLQYAEKKKIDGIIAYASDPSALTGAYVCSEMHLQGADFDSVKMLSEKDQFRTFQRENGFNAPWFFAVSDVVQISKFIDKVQYPCMVKPVDSSGSKGVSRVDREEELESAVSKALQASRCGRSIVEGYIPTPYHQLHGDGVVVNGKLAFAALGDQRFRNSVPIGSSLPSNIDDVIMEKVREEVSNIIECSGFRNGGINIEVRVTDKKEVYVVEIGPRTGGNYVPQLMEAATGVDEVTAVLQLAMGEECNIKDSQIIHPCFQYIVGSDESGYFKEIFMDEYIKSKVVQQFIHKKEGDWIDEYENSNGVVGVILLEFKNVEEMESDIINIKEHIRVIVGEKQNEEE